MSEIILITGVPGFGKTTIGDYLEEKHGFLNLDIEAWREWNKSLLKLRDLFANNELAEFIPEAERINNKIVITWGFVPGGNDETVLGLVRLGAKMIWFDGNREAGKRVYIQRNGSAEAIEALNAQIDRINAMDLSRFNARIINTFDASGEFLLKEEIVTLIRK